MPTIDDLRQRFFAFFREREHVVVPPSSLIPDDPSVLFTTAGMQQFKPYYTAERNPLTDIHAAAQKPLGALCAATIQPCMRTSDIDAVGDASHLTFFEMMGNFAFQGAYFKREAIEYAWRFLTEQCDIASQRLWVTVFAGDRDVPEDRDSRTLWEAMGASHARISSAGRDANFWGPTGNEGPCGPTTEIHYERTAEPCAKGENCKPNCDCGRFLELWNLVFNEYYHGPDGSLTKLTAKGVDTGMGLERLALVYFGAPDVFESPLLSRVVGRIVRESPRFPEAAREAARTHRTTQALEIARNAGAELQVRSARIIADHLRAALFLLHEGVLPSNTDRGYVLRRLIRRAALHAQLLDVPKGWAETFVDAILPVYAETYPSLLSSNARVLSALAAEVGKFEQTLTRGLKEFEKLARTRLAEDQPVSGEDLFRLFETYGFPSELSAELARERGLAVKLDDFSAARARHQERSRAGSERKFGGHGLVLNTGELRAKDEQELSRVLRQHTATHMLQAALRKVLGPEVEQRGSDITAERLRFDFTFPRKVTQDELRHVEELVNEKGGENLPVEWKEMSFRDAVSGGALAFAKGAYPEVVSVYTIPGFSKEVCGGPHVERTGEIGTFRILREEASAHGIRRIRATVEP